MGGAALEPLGGAVLLSVVAGVTEEASRWLWFRWAQRRGRASRPIDGVMAGLGHGGLEALWFALPMAFLALGLATDNLIQGTVVPPAIDLLLPGLMRPVFVLGHVGFSMAVWMGARAGDRRWLWGAIGVHILADLVGFGGPLLFPEASHGISVGLLVAVFVGLA